MMTISLLYPIFRWKVVQAKGSCWYSPWNAAERVAAGKKNTCVSMRVSENGNLMQCSDKPTC